MIAAPTASKAAMRAACSGPPPRWNSPPSWKRITPLRSIKKVTEVKRWNTLPTNPILSTGTSRARKKTLTLECSPGSILVMKRMRDGITIGDLAGACGVSRDTLRFYERERLLPPARRTASGYRLYGQDDAGRVRFIRRAQAIGLTLDGSCSGVSGRSSKLRPDVLTLEGQDLRGRGLARETQAGVPPADAPVRATFGSSTIVERGLHLDELDRTGLIAARAVLVARHVHGAEVGFELRQAFARPARVRPPQGP
jgi:DNA-binding transcriptional MerR regulator